LRRLAALTLILTAVALLAFPGAALGQPVVAAPEFVDSFPDLVPVTSTAEARPRPHAHASGALGLDGLALGAAIYWLLLGALALRRSRLRTAREDPVPIAGWVLGCAPPLPR
jgi:hypothetical protein